MTVFFLSHASTSGWGPRTVTFLDVVLRVVFTVCRPERDLERCLVGGEGVRSARACCTSLRSEAGRRT